MSATTAPEKPAKKSPPNPWIGEAPPSPAGRVDSLDGLRPVPEVQLPRLLQTLRISVRQLDFVFRARRELGEVFGVNGIIHHAAVTSHPDHVKSLFTADPADAPSITGESPLRPIVGPNSTLTALGERHMRQRKLMLPHFHGKAVERYVAMIEEATHREIDRWPVGTPFQLAPRMQAITLDVIMSGIFGVPGKAERGTPEHRLRQVLRRLVWLSTQPISQLGELLNTGSSEPVGPTKTALGVLDRATYAIIDARREQDLEGRNDILSLLLQTTDDDGTPLTRRELRDELLTLVLAGHETTANSLAWTFERLVRTPAAYERLRDATRSGEDSTEVVEATIYEGMRSRPVIPIIGRRVAVPWRLGDYGVEAGRPVLMSILLVHHRPDLYPEPYAFRPERFIGHKPGTYEWIPFGGGIRRCLGASLAMAEQKVVLEAVARRTDMAAADPEPERVVHRNVTMIPARGATVVVRDRRPA
ncbi:MAG TPA: cytochrome P450 [Solirubrobacteraceae bacterium]|nr:cytochrome P450 [Solirubrobacteraceae bacterium]